MRSVVVPSGEIAAMSACVRWRDREYVSALLSLPAAGPSLAPWDLRKGRAVESRLQRQRRLALREKRRAALLAKSQAKTLGNSFKSDPHTTLGGTLAGLSHGAGTSEHSDAGSDGSGRSSSNDEDPVVSLRVYSLKHTSRQVVDEWQDLYLEQCALALEAQIDAADESSSSESSGSDSPKDKSQADEHGTKNQGHPDAEAPESTQGERESSSEDQEHDESEDLTPSTLVNGIPVDEAIRACAAFAQFSTAPERFSRALHQQDRIRGVFDFNPRLLGRGAESTLSTRDAALVVPCSHSRVGFVSIPMEEVQGRYKKKRRRLPPLVVEDIDFCPEKE